MKYKITFQGVIGMAHVPQVEQPLKVWAAMIGGAFAAALFEYGTIQGHRIAGWGDLYNALPQVTFEAVKALLYTTVLASPLSKRALEQRQIMKAGAKLGDKATDAALDAVESVNTAVNEAVVQQLESAHPPVPVPPKQ